MVVGRCEEGGDHAGVEGQRLVQHSARPARGEEANSFASRRRQSNPNGEANFLNSLPYFWVLRRGAETLVRARRERRVSYDEVLKHIACSRP